MNQRDIIWSQNLDEITEIKDDDSVFIYDSYGLHYSSGWWAPVIELNKEKIDIFIENILENRDCHFDYVIGDFYSGTAIATFIYRNKYIYYTIYEDDFSNPFDCAKVKVDDVILDRLRQLPQISINSNDY